MVIQLVGRRWTVTDSGLCSGLRCKPVEGEKVARVKGCRLKPSRADGDGRRHRWLKAFGVALLEGDYTASDYAAGVVAY